MKAVAVLPSQGNIVSFRSNLLSWFRHSGRDFPWRMQRDPYAILLAEKLLQQTAARDIVVRAYDHLLREYPTPLFLAQASVVEIEDIIRPLGFIYRAKDLQKMARVLVNRYDGQVPRDLASLLALPGVGDYAARAVLSFAFGEDIPVVDTNVARFLYRVYGIPGDQPANPARNRKLIDLAAQLVPPGQSHDYNLAVLDLCATVCKRANPACAECPVKVYCTYGTATGVR